MSNLTKVPLKGKVDLPSKIGCQLAGGNRANWRVLEPLVKNKRGNQSFLAALYVINQVRFLRPNKLALGNILALNFIRHGFLRVNSARAQFAAGIASALGKV